MITYREPTFYLTVEILSVLKMTNTIGAESRVCREVMAVDCISFRAEEVLGFLGQKRGDKTTTIKVIDTSAAVTGESAAVEGHDARMAPKE